MALWRTIKGCKLLVLTSFFAVSAGVAIGGLVTQETLAQEQERSRTLNFEESLIEGVNKRPYDSLSQINENDKKKKKPHLYRKRPHFRSETEETLREVRFLQ